MPFTLVNREWKYADDHMTGFDTITVIRAHAYNGWLKVENFDNSDNAYGEKRFDKNRYFDYLEQSDEFDFDKSGMSYTNVYDAIGCMFTAFKRDKLNPMVQVLTPEKFYGWSNHMEESPDGLYGRFDWDDPKKKSNLQIFKSPSV